MHTYLKWGQFKFGDTVGVLLPDGKVVEGKILQTQWRKHKIPWVKVEFEWNGETVFRRPIYSEEKSRVVGAISLVKMRSMKEIADSLGNDDEKLNGYVAQVENQEVVLRLYSNGNPTNVFIRFEDAFEDEHDPEVWQNAVNLQKQEDARNF